MASRDLDDAGPSQVTLETVTIDDSADSQTTAINETISFDQTDKKDRLKIHPKDDPQKKSKSFGLLSQDPEPNADVTELESAASDSEAELEEESSKPQERERIDDEIEEDRDRKGEVNDPAASMIDDMRIGSLLNAIGEMLPSTPGRDISTSEGFSHLLGSLLMLSATLNADNVKLKESIKAVEEASDSSDAGKEEQDTDTHQPQNDALETFHVVMCRASGRQEKNYFRDEPRMWKGDLKTDHLRGQSGIENLSKYMEHRPYIAAAIIKMYNCSCNHGQNFHRIVGYKDGKLIANSPPAEFIKKYLRLSNAAKYAIRSIIGAHSERFNGFSSQHFPQIVGEPFFPFYVHNKTFLELVDSSGLDDDDCKRVKALCQWLDENFKNDWDEADELFSRKKVTAKHYRKLFRPGELMIKVDESKDRLVSAILVEEYPWRIDEQDNDAIEIRQWVFNGSFIKINSKFNVKAETNEDPEITQRDGEKDITSLHYYPIRFAEPGMYERLIARGHKFWQCRKKKFITYLEPGDGKNAIDQGEQRFMVDYDIFRKLHPRKDIFQIRQDDLGAEAMAKDEPPGDTFLALLPATIHAFDLSSKAWQVIQVDRITDVTWNKDAFKRLVIPDQSRELIEAAVTSHGSLSVAPDIIGGKGRGLLMLLHGGPGTGKTMTAETIAEAQERPLYRVTCGDIGIEPEHVERYLQTVLIIGKAWGCVVLLDEADVFLEERSMSDQKQNAVVSVFLRVLEYYDGILVLTSNRVGTFDEAFKSRIHLAIRYSDLDEDQRVEIWRNFITALRSTKERIDIQDLEMNTHKLAQVNMNGRQIRNVITLARYLAKHRKQMLVYKHVQDAVASVLKFDEYLLTVRGSDDKWAREQRLR